MPLFPDGGVSMTKGFSSHVKVSFMLISAATVLGLVTATINAQGQPQLNNLREVSK
jgi:hypothetical protein